MQFSVLCLVVAILCRGVICFGDDTANVWPSVDCEADDVGYFPPCGCGPLSRGCGPLSPVNAWCVGTIDDITIPNPGAKRWIERKEMAQNCTSACGDAEKKDPNPITVTVDASVQYTNSVTEGITGGIEGGTFLAGIKASLAYETAVQNGVVTTVGSSISVNLPPCEWQVLKSKLRVVEGKKIQGSGAISKAATFTCLHETYTHVWTPINVTVTRVVDGAVQGSGWSGSIDNGECPPDPPEEY